MIKPTRAQGDIRLGGIPYEFFVPVQHLAAPEIFLGYAYAFHPAAVRVLRVVRYGLRVEYKRGHDAPLVLPGDPRLVAHPAYVGTAIGYAGAGLQFAHNGVISLEIVPLTRSPVHVGAARAVQPHAEDVAVAGEQFGELTDIKVVVLVRPVKFAVPVPGGKIDAEFQSEFAAALRHFRDHIALAVLIRRGTHRIIGGVRLPKAEAVVVLAGEDNARGSRRLCTPHPIVRVLRRGSEQRRGRRPVSPFFSRKSVYAVMDKYVERVLLHGFLPRGRQDGDIPLNSLSFRHLGLRKAGSPLT